MENERYDVFERVEKRRQENQKIAIESEKRMKQAEITYRICFVIIVTCLIVKVLLTLLLIFIYMGK